MEIMNLPSTTEPSMLDFLGARGAAAALSPAA